MDRCGLPCSAPLSCHSQQHQSPTQVFKESTFTNSTFFLIFILYCALIIYFILLWATSILFSQQHTRQQEIMSESLCIQRSTHLTASALQQASGRDAQAGTKMGGVDYKLSRVSCVQTDAEALPILGYILQYMNACTQGGCTCLPLKF